MKCLYWDELTFIKYCHNELLAAEKVQFQTHLTKCWECQERFELAWEVIIDDSESASNLAEDEDIDRLLESPFWKQAKEELIQQQVNNIVQQYNQQPIKAYIATPSKSKQKQHQPSYRIMVMKIAAMVILVLAPALLSYWLLFRPVIARHQSIISSTTPITELTRYERLDQQLDLYLASLQTGNKREADQALASVTAIAEEMAVKTGDLLGRDLLANYQLISDNNVRSLQEARRLQKEVETTIVGDQYSLALQKADQALNLFNQLNINCETERTHIQIAKYLIKSGKYDQANEIIRVTLAQAVKYRHIYYQAQLLNWRGESFSATSDFRAASESFETAIELAESLELKLFFIGPSMALAGIYHLTNNNEAALACAEKTLAIARPINHKYTAQLLQIAGISAFNLNRRLVAQQYLNDAIMVSRDQANPAYLAMSYTLFGIIQAEQGKAYEADINLKAARQALAQIKDPISHISMNAMVTGYYARVQMLAGNSEAAIELYQNALLLAQQINIQQKLMLSQLHQGLGECLMAKSNYRESAQQLALAVALDQEARANSEISNPLLTFAVTRRSSKEQLRDLDY
ncbi:MAG: hypothetical protein AB1489_38575 [Acidobacteriota bacterium]